MKAAGADLFVVFGCPDVSELSLMVHIMLFFIFLFCFVHMM